ncbi:MAG: hypothetical protein IJS13_08990 [Paludibacteraceae bacterium]|nr:hypothetical protein [Paludibacteraceae bacterium]
MLSVAVFALLLTLYRREDGMRELYVSSLFVSLLSLFFPDYVVTLPLMWLAAGVQKALNFRVWSASVLGVATVVLYAALTLVVFPNADVVAYVVNVWKDATVRGWCWEVMPLWINVVSLLMALLGLLVAIAHLRRFVVANVRIQTRLLISLPAMLLALLSCCYTAVNGTGVFALLWTNAIYIAVLYITTYGLPQLPSWSRSDPYRRSFSRRSRRR